MTLNWWHVLGAGWFCLWALSVGQTMLPTWVWFDPGDLRIEDAQVGECPPVEFDREIHRRFSASWKVTILRRDGDGFATAMPPFEGRNDYRPGNVLPTQLDLCWWTWGDFTMDPLPVGQYRVNTVWTLSLPGGPRDVRRGSNVFEVTE